MMELFRICCFTVLLSLVTSNALDDYVFHDDGYYSYELLKTYTYRAPDYTSYMINMTSQKWLTEKETNRPVWWHYLTIHIPHEFPDEDMKKSGYLFIDGGNNDNPLNVPDETDNMLMFTGLLAATTKSVVANLKQIPNQHMIFKDDPQQTRREEDAIIAYTWRHFLGNPNDTEWLLRFPMTKAVIKAIDTVQDFASKTAGVNVERFCVGGASKRGWTTWTSAAVDNKRIQCITPIVMDELNIVQNLHHHYKAYGGWSFAFDDYYHADITKDLDTPNMQLLADLVDPISYKDRLTMPKLVVSTGGDEFFLPDDSYYYLSQMKGPIYVNMLPNAEHSCAGHELQLLFNIQAFYTSVFKNYTLPNATWFMYNTANGGGIDVTVSTTPTLIRSWSASTVSTERRDFRLLKGNTTDPSSRPLLQPNIWHAQDVKQVGPLKYRAEYDYPLLGGWKAFFIQMTFPGPNGTAIEFTTETNIIPNKFPFNDCYGESCKGTLV